MVLRQGELALAAHILAGEVSTLAEINNPPSLHMELVLVAFWIAQGATFLTAVLRRQEGDVGEDLHGLEGFGCMEDADIWIKETKEIQESLLAGFPVHHDANQLIGASDSHGTPKGWSGFREPGVVGG